MKGFLRKFCQEEAGLTLLELAVVVAILGILAALAAVGGAGASTQARSEAKKKDIADVQRAVFDYIGNHHKAHHPTIDGCLPGESFDSIGKRCNPVINPGLFDVEDPLTFRAIIWDKALLDIDGNIESLFPDMIRRLLKHALEHQDGSTWPQTRGIDPEGINEEGLRSPSEGEVPVWVLDGIGDVHVTLATSAY